MITTNKTKKSEVKQKDVMQTKVIVRLLPPTLTLEKFLEEVSPLSEYSYLNYVPAEKGLGQFAYCRAVIGFKKADDVFIFTEKFDGYVFVDAKGSEYPAVVEYAPYQRVPLSTRRNNAKEGTIEDDEDYNKFLEQLENPASQPVKTVQETMEEMDSKAAKRVAAQADTPLLNHMNKIRMEKKLMQERMRDEKRRAEIKRKKRREEGREKLEEKSTKSARCYDDEVTVVTIPRTGKPSEVKKGEVKGGKKSAGQSKHTPTNKTNKQAESKSSGENSSSKLTGEKSQADADVATTKSEDRLKSFDDKTRSKERFDKARPRTASGKPERQGFKEYTRHDSKPKVEQTSVNEGTAVNPQVSEKPTNSPTTDTTSGDSSPGKPKVKLTSRDYDGVEVRTIERKPREKPPTSESSTSDVDKSARRKKPERAIYNPAQRAAERRAKQADGKPEYSVTPSHSDTTQ